MDMMNNADALPTCPQLQQKQQQTADRNWLKLTHTTARRRFIFEAVPLSKSCSGTRGSNRPIMGVGFVVAF
jgi:hypothetical protein